jgi:CBS-domain-containing membrane protein
LFSGLGSFLGIGLLAYLSVGSGYPLIAAPFGATAVLVFAVPESPLAQPRNVIGGNCIGALVCIALVHFFGFAQFCLTTWCRVGPILNTGYKSSSQAANQTCCLAG